MPNILVFGDVHGHLDTMIKAIDQGTDFVLQVGDFGAYLPTSNLSALPPHRRTDLGQFSEYFESQKSFPVPTYFCKGNHEDFDLLAKYENGDAIIPNLYYVPNGKVIEIQGVRIGFLGGNFSSRWFDQPIPNKCQSQKILGYLRKSEIDLLKAYVGKIDILVTHEPSFAPQFTGNRKYGCAAIQDLIETVQPAFAFSGHIHKYAEGSVGRTKCIALGAVNYQGRSVYQLSI